MQHTHTINVQTQPRRYHVIASDGPRRDRPVIVFLHGTGGTPTWAAEETQLDRFAVDHSILLLLPEGLPSQPDKRINFLRNPPRWNDGSTHVGQTRPLEQDDVAFLDAMLDDAANRYGFDTNRILMTGFSNGAGMTFRYASERSSKLAAIAPVAGHCWVDTGTLTPPVPTLYIIGTLDPLIPFQGGTPTLPWPGEPQPRPSVMATLQQWATMLGNATNAQALGSNDSAQQLLFPGEVSFEALFINGLGHHWPGGLGQLNRRIAGPYTDVVDANSSIWQWFCDVLG